MINWLDKLFVKQRKPVAEFDNDELLVQYKLACLGESSRSIKNLRSEVDRQGLEL